MSLLVEYVIACWAFILLSYGVAWSCSLLVGYLRNKGNLRARHCLFGMSLLVLHLFFCHMSLLGHISLLVGHLSIPSIYIYK